MTVLDLLRPLTSHTTQLRGLEYTRRVESLHGDARSVNATVLGTQLYDVEIRVDAGRLKVFCSCPYFVDQESVCKHLWAIATLANERGWLIDLPNTLRVEVDLDAFDDYDFTTDLGDLDVDDTAAMAGQGPEYGNRLPLSTHSGYRSTLPPRRPPAPPEWAVALQALTSDAPERPVSSWPGSQLIYVVTASPGATMTEVPMSVERQDRKKNGEWSKPQPSRLTFDAIPQLPHADDRWALSLMHSTSAYPRSSGSYGYGLNAQPLGVTYLRASLMDLLLPRLCGTGRVRLRLAAGPFTGSVKSDDDVALEWEEGEPWRFELLVTKDSGAGVAARGYRVDAELSRGTERANIRDFTLLTESVAVRNAAAARFDPAGGFAWAAQLRQRGPLVIPAESSRSLVDALIHAGLEHVRLPEELQWEERVVAPRFRITIGAPSPYYGVCPIDVEVDYDSARAAIGGGARVMSDDGHVVYRRDLDAEHAAVATLKRLGVAGLEPHLHQQATIHDRRVTTLVHTLVAQGWAVEAEGVRYRAIPAPRLRIRSGIDWFELDAVNDADDVTIDVGDLLKALATGRRTVTLGDGAVGMLPEDWLARVAPALSIGEADEGRIRFKPSQVALIDALLATQPQVDWDEGFTRARDALKRFDGVRAEDPAPTFAGTLRDYQRESLGWMRFLREFGFGGCLADDMGLGKTVMVLAMLDARRSDVDRPHKPSLIVLPRSLLFNWMSEAARFTPQLRVLDFAHTDRHSVADLIAHADLILTTYGTLRRDVAMLQQHHFDYVVLDESQAIKNAGTATAKAARLLRAEHRLALTGTPVENHLGELQSLFDFLNPGLFGKARLLDGVRAGRASATGATGLSAVAPRGAKADATSSPRRLVRRSAEGREVGSSEGAETGLPRRSSEGAEAGAADNHLRTLARGLRPFFLRRTKEQVAPELPARTEETLYCELEGEQLALYQQLREHYRRVLLKMVDRQGLRKSTVQVLEALLRLRQAACHTGLLVPQAVAGGGAPPRAVKAGRSSAKFDVLLPRLAELVTEGQKALVFSQFTSLLALLRNRLDAEGVVYEYLDGQTRDRQAHVERFQEDASCPLFLISLKAGGVGLNLTAAEYVFLLDPWWNPAVEMQAIDRTHRIGQAKPVFAYRLVARNTVEERILELQSRKRELADAILDAGSGGLRGLQREDLEQLLS